MSSTPTSTGILPNMLAIDTFFEVEASVSTIARISADATLPSASSVSSENFTSAIVCYPL